GIDERHLPGHQPSRAHPASVVAGFGLLPDARHVFRQDLLGHIGQRDRAVVVDKYGERWLARGEGRDGRRQGRPAVHRRTNGSVYAHRVSATPRTITAPPTTCAGRI